MYKSTLTNIAEEREERYIKFCVLWDEEMWNGFNEQIIRTFAVPIGSHNISSEKKQEEMRFGNFWSIPQAGTL